MADNVSVSALKQKARELNNQVVNIEIQLRRAKDEVDGLQRQFDQNNGALAQLSNLIQEFADEGDKENLDEETVDEETPAEESNGKPKSKRRKRKKKVEAEEDPRDEAIPEETPEIEDVEEVEI
jgi:chromosome segregation ATPase